jgi:hypothetical protein
MRAARAPRAARVDPAGRPLEGRRRQGFQAVGIVVGWIFLVSMILWATGGTRQSAAPVPWMLAMGVTAWALAELVAGRRGLVWPGSALAIFGSLSMGLGFSIITPELRLGEPEIRLAIIAGVAAVCMFGCLLRYRLPGLVSPVVTFSIIALFLGLYGVDPARMAEVEGFSPRGILAAMLGSPVAVACFTAFSAAAVFAARWLDLKGDDFGLAAARPLHLVGAGVLALIVGRWLSLLPAPLDWIALLAAWAGVTVWALRINRIGVMFTAILAMARPTAIALGGSFGFTFQRSDWGWYLPLILVTVIAVWPWLHEQSLRRNWTLGPGGRIPTPRNNWYWRYWPYS